MSIHRFVILVIHADEKPFLSSFDRKSVYSAELEHKLLRGTKLLQAPTRLGQEALISTTTTLGILSMRG